MGCIFLSTQLTLTDAQLPQYLQEVGLVEDDTGMTVETAGDGNINWVRRVRLPSGGSVIVKQARRALEKFPEYEAPTERLAFEARWFSKAAPFDLAGICPKIIHFDGRNRVLVMEDLERAERLDDALARGADVLAPMRDLATLLGRIHAGTEQHDAELAAEFQNEAMQRLHGDHIFALPYSEEFPCPPETAKVAASIRADAALGAIAARAYERYLTPRGALVHADVQAGNILLDKQRPRLLDAEIAHVGDPAFDVGTLLAHLALPSVARGRGVDAEALLASTWSAYREGHGGEHADLDDVLRYAGLELTRRTVGAARVPAVETDEAGLRVLEAGLAWVREPGRGLTPAG